jgi:threonine dehydratase
VIRRTPLYRPSGPAGERLGPGVALKLENLQRTGSFKLRGAVRAVAALSQAQRAVGVVAASAGSHGTAMSLACAAAGVPLTVVVSEVAPMVKRAAIAAHGAELLVRGAGYDEAEAAAIALAAERGAFFVSPFDDDHVIAGNGGDLAAEILDQAADVSRVIVPLGGGGMAGGLGAALAPRGVSVIGVQPETNCAMYHAVAAGEPVADYRGGPTLADALAGDGVARRNVELCARHLASIALVSEPDIRAAIAFLYREAGTVAEASGAVGVAALLAGKVAPAGAGTTVVIVSGGNIEPDLLDEILAA